MYRSVHKDLSRVRGSISSRQYSIRLIDVAHRMIVLPVSMIVIFKLFASNYRQIHKWTPMFAVGYTPMPFIPGSLSKQHVQRRYMSFALNDSSGRAKETVDVLEAIDDGMAESSVSIPSLDTNTPSTTSASSTIQQFMNGLHAPTTTLILTDDAEFIRPDRDLRSYRFIQLSNNLRCLLVCDNMKSGVGVEAASVHVQAGHFDDTIPGLARTL